MPHALLSIAATLLQSELPAGTACYAAELPSRVQRRASEPNNAACRSVLQACKLPLAVLPVKVQASLLLDCLQRQFRGL